MEYGVAYYPEQVERTEWVEDIRLMKEAGFNLIRIGEFAWGQLEPAEGVYDFDWIKTIVEYARKEEIQVMIGTPTAVLPQWMVKKHPDWLQVLPDGSRKRSGRRRYVCISQPEFQRAALKIVKKLVENFVENEAVIGWQIDNELMSEGPFCYCDTCCIGFREWLKARYFSINSLNEAWNMGFWGKTFNNFNEIELPIKGDFPAIYQAYQEYMSDSYTAFVKMQADIIRAYSRHQFITTNICSSGFLYHWDLYELGKHLDYMSIDNYPFAWTLEQEYNPAGEWSYTPSMASFALSQCRGSKNKKFLVAEKQIGRTAGRQRYLVEPGQLALWTHQEIAHGAKALVYFQWRSFPSGCEHMMPGVLDRDGIPRRRFFEIKELIGKIKTRELLLNQMEPCASIAVIRDFQCDFAFEAGNFHTEFRYMKQIYQYYRTFREMGCTIDVISDQSEFLCYRLLIMPAQVIWKNELGKRLKDYVSQGGVLLTGCLNGMKDLNLLALTGMMSKELEELAGVSILEQFALDSRNRQLLSDSEGNQYEGSLWIDVIKTATATAWIRYEQGFLEGGAAVSIHTYGAGKVIYVGTIPDDKLLKKIAEKGIQEAGIVRIACGQSELVEIMDERIGNDNYLYIINHHKEVQTVLFFYPVIDLDTGIKIKGDFALNGKAVKFFKVSQAGE